MSKTISSAGENLSRMFPSFKEKCSRLSKNKRVGITGDTTGCFYDAVNSIRTEIVV